MKSIAGTYELDGRVPDGLSQKQLAIFEDGRIVCCLSEGRNLRQNFRRSSLLVFARKGFQYRYKRVRETPFITPGP